MLTWKKIPGSPRFTILQVTESWAEPGNEAKVMLHAKSFATLKNIKYWMFFIVSGEYNSTQLQTPVFNSFR